MSGPRIVACVGIALVQVGALGSAWVVSGSRGVWWALGDECAGVITLAVVAYVFQSSLAERTRRDELRARFVERLQKHP